MTSPSTFAALMLLAAVPAQAASPAEGLWRTPTNNGEVLISACGEALCGKIVTSDRIKLDAGLADTHNKDATLRARPLKDLPILQGFTGGPAEWKGGTVYNPEDGGTYKGSIKLVDPDTLKLTGCIVFPLCKSERWTRIR
jgi:uncharacterized protein (DUF2147 family)